MARRRFVPTFVLLSLAFAGAVVGAEAPVAVSPGHASRLALIEDRCPTFSWGEVEGAKSYELVVYRVGERGEEAKPLLRQNIAGSALSWTPSLDRCLERGGQYAWSVRAMGGHDASEWSSPSLFEVAAGPSEAEFEEAVAVVRQYLKQEDTRSAKAAGENAEPSSERGSSPLVMPTAGVEGPSPLSVGTGDSALQVNGSPVVTVATLEAGCLGRRWLDQGDGTVLDCNTRLIWLKDASCLGTGTWGLNTEVGTVQRQVGFFNIGILEFGCADYTEGTYTDWRVPEIKELCSAGAIYQGCPFANWDTSLADTRFAASPKVSNADGDGQWAEGDPFVGVQSDFYWSSTTNASNTGDAWGVNLNDGNVSYDGKTFTKRVWPVRGGQ